MISKHPQLSTFANMMNKYILLIISLAVTPVFAQDSLMNRGKYIYLDTKTLWHNTYNAAGLGLDMVANHGIANFDYSYYGGDYHRVQEGTSTHNLQFFTERFQQISKTLYGYGKFDFNNGRTKDRAWADVMRPYNSDPYFSGSSVFGNYDFQNIGLTAAIGTTKIGRWNFGGRLDYNLGDLSRLRDPRSRAELLDYKFTPSAIYSFGNSSIGLAAWYNRRKEKIQNVTTVQTDPTLKYYLMSGLENANGTIGGYGSFSREWVNHNFGTEISYGYNGYGFNSLNTISIQRGSESVLGTYKYSPGHYYNYIYGLQSQNRMICGKLINQFDFKVSYEEGFADEYRQKLIINTDSATGFNSYRYETQIKFNKRYQVKLFDIDAHYRLSFTEGNAVFAYTGLKVNYNTASNKYLLNTSELKYGRLNIALEDGMNFCNTGFGYAFSAGYSFSTRNTINLANSNNEYAQGVLLSDMKYYAVDYGFVHGELSYEHPIKIKGTTSNWFAKVYGDYLKTKKYENSAYNKYTLGVSVGIIY